MRNYIWGDMVRWGVRKLDEWSPAGEVGLRRWRRCPCRYDNRKCQEGVWSYICREKMGSMGLVSAGFRTIDRPLFSWHGTLFLRGFWFVCREVREVPYRLFVAEISMFNCSFKCWNAYSYEVSKESSLNIQGMVWEEWGLFSFWTSEKKIPERADRQTSRKAPQAVTQPGRTKNVCSRIFWYTASWKVMKLMIDSAWHA
jgi:hypothetical protein